MTVITHRRGKSRLGTLIDQAGGVSVGVALAQAKANLEHLREACLAQIRTLIAELSAIPAPATAAEAPERLIRAYQASSGVIDAAGPFEMADLCAAAANLCDLIDGAEDRQMDWRIVTVHARALQLLVGLPPEAQAERTAVLENLRMVLEHRARQTG